MYRPGYGVVTSVVAVLCVLGALIMVTRRAIPRRSANRLANEQEDFLRQGGYQPVNWKKLSPESLTEARRLGLPILLLIGTPTTAVGRRLDEDVFPSADIAIYVGRNFTCIRVDAASRPQWLNGFLPFSRLGAPFDPDLQIWALDPSGHPFGSVARYASTDRFDPDPMLDEFIELRRKFDSLPLQGEGEVGVIQDHEHTSLRSLTGRSTPPFESYRERLRHGADFAWTSRGLTRPAPFAMRFLLRMGDWAAVSEAEGLLFSSPLVDLTDGGFFHTWIHPSATGWVELEKQNVENADLLLALSEIAAGMKDRRARRFAKDTWEYLASAAHTKDAFYYGQAERSDPGRRSLHYSVSSRRARETLPPEIRDWARQHLGLNLALHPQGIPFLESADREDPKTIQVIMHLRSTAQPAPQGAEFGLADVSLTCVARAIQSARLLGDNVRLKQARGWLNQLEPLRKGDDVRRRVDGGDPPLGSLPSYIAYSEARLQDYLTSGDTRSLHLGLAVLQKARKLFRGERRGEFRIHRPDMTLSIPDTLFPEIADNLHESATAATIRLMLNYGRLLGPTPRGVDLRSEAHEASMLFAPLAAHGSVASAGFFMASAEEADPTAAFSVGPQAVRTANALAELAPTRLVAPAIGQVRPDLQLRGSGIYIDHGVIDGPFTLEEARRRLTVKFNLPGVR